MIQGMRRLPIRQGWTYRPNDIHVLFAAFSGTAQHLRDKHRDVLIPEVSEPLTTEDKRALAIAHVRAHGGTVYDETGAPVGDDIGRYAVTEDLRIVPMP